jgi:hypothetical protein
MLSPSDASIIAELTATPPPKGFLVTASRDAHPAITYRTAGLVGIAVFFAVWLTGWTAACVFATYALITGRGHFAINGGLVTSGLWLSDLGVLAHVLWFFFSETTVTFYPDRLLVERRLARYCRRDETTRQSIRAVRQVQDGGRQDSFPTWGLLVDSDGETQLLSRQLAEKSAWLGPIVAHWAGVEYQSSFQEKYEKIQPVVSRNR